MRGNTVRKQVFIYAGIALALAVAVVLWFLLTQRNVDRLFEHGERVNVMLIGHAADGAVDLLTLLSFSETDAVLFALPADLRVRDDSEGYQQAAALCDIAGDQAGTRAIGDLLGIEIPFFVSYEHATLESWIDALGGVTVTLNASAVYLDSSSDPEVHVELRAGAQLLNGMEAVAFATMPSESGDIGLLDRQRLLFRAAITDGIQKPSLRSLRNTVRSMTPALQTNLSSSDLIEAAEVLHGIPQTALRSDLLTGEIVEIEGITYTQPSVVETERVVAAALRGLDLLTPSDVKVAVFNGNGVRLMARTTADYLLARGFQVTAVANADRFDYQASYVIVLTDESKAWILLDALPGTAQIVFPETFATHYNALKDYIPAGTDIVLIAGPGLEME